MGKERLTELDKKFASMTKEQAKGIAMAISDMMKKPPDDLIFSISSYRFIKVPPSVSYS